MPTICRRTQTVFCRGREGPAAAIREGGRMFGQEGARWRQGLIPSIGQMQTGKPRGFNEIACLAFVIADNERKGGGHIGGLVCCIHVVSRTDSIRKGLMCQYHDETLKISFGTSDGDRRMMYISKGKGAEISLMSAHHSHSWSDSWRREGALQTSQFIL